MFPRYLQYLLTFVTGASWDTDDRITFLGQKVKVQGHTIAAEAHSTRRYRRVQLFLVEYARSYCNNTCSPVRSHQTHASLPVAVSTEHSNSTAHSSHSTCTKVESIDVIEKQQGHAVLPCYVVCCTLWRIV